MAVTGCAESKQEPGKSSEEIHTAVEDNSGTTDTNAAVELKINSSETGEEDSTKDYVIELSAKIQSRMLNGFNRWNMGYDEWEKLIDSFYADNISLNYLGEDISPDDYKAEVRKQTENTKKVRINNILISEDWAAVHYWTVTTAEDGTKDADNHMEFRPYALLPMSLTCGDPEASLSSKNILRSLCGMELNIIVTAVSAGVILSVRSHSRVIPAAP